MNNIAMSTLDLLACVMLFGLLALTIIATRFK